MAKPILIIKLPINTMVDLSNEERKSFATAIKKDLKGEYHVILTTCLGTKPEFDCVNDHKGLRDADIKKLINKYHHEAKTEESKEA